MTVVRFPLRRRRFLRAAKGAIELLVTVATLLTLIVQYFAYFKFAGQLLAATLPFQSICVGAGCVAAVTLTYGAARILISQIARCAKNLQRTLCPYWETLSLVTRASRVWRTVGYRLRRNGCAFYDHSGVSLADYEALCLQRAKSVGPLWLKQVNWELTNALEAA